MANKLVPLAFGFAVLAIIVGWRIIRIYIWG